MSIKIMQQVWDNAPVSGGTLLVLLALADSADDKMRSCFPGIDGLAHKARLSDRQVKRAISDLTEAGIIRVERNASPYKTNLYTLSPVTEWPRGDNLSPPDGDADGTFATGRGDTHVPSDGTPMSPKPSVTSDEPSDLFGSIEPHSGTALVKSKKADRFDDFWSVYPLKDGKEAARKAWAKAIRKTNPQEIIDGAARYARWLNSAAPGEFRPQPKFPQGWLNTGRWADASINVPPAPVAEDAAARRARLMGPQFGRVVR